MAKVSLRWLGILGAILTPIFVLFWALGGLGSAAKITAILVAVLIVALPIVMLVAAPMLLIPIAIHEAGHYLAGRSVGFRFVVAVVGPFGWRQEGDRVVRFRARPAISGGYVSMVPEDERDVERRYARFILGGPLASLGLVALVFSLWWLSGVPIAWNLPQGAGDGAHLCHKFFAFSALGSLMALPGTLLPFRVKALGGMPTDMMRLLALRRGDAESRSIFAVLSLHRMLLAGVPAGELPPALLRNAEREGAEDAQQIGALQLRWAYELHHDPQAAEATAARLEALLTKIREGLPKDWADGVDLLQAEHAVYVRHDADFAEARLASVASSHPTYRLTKVTIEAAIAAIRQASDLDDRIAAAEAELAIVSSRTSQSLEFERLWLASMREGWPRDD